MAEFETVRSEVHELGKSGFLSVERKRVKQEGKDPSEFLLVARGYYLRDGSARRRNFVTLPDETEAKEFVAEALRKV